MQRSSAPGGAAHGWPRGSLMSRDAGRAPPEGRVESLGSPAQACQKLLLVPSCLATFMHVTLPHRRVGRRLPSRGDSSRLVPGRRRASPAGGRRGLDGEHAERSRRADHLARSGNLRERRRLLGCRRPLQVVLVELRTRPHRALCQRSLEPGGRWGRAGGHLGQPFRGQLPFSHELLGRWHAQWLASRQSPRALRCERPLEPLRDAGPAR